jgi:predicted acylesterase/phospholipase RssA
MASPFLDIPAVSRARYLALPSGGARGIATPGALQAVKELCGVDFGTDLVAGAVAGAVRLDDASPPPLPERRLRGVSGTSIGAMQALMVALRFSVEDMWRHIVDARFSDFARIDPMQLLTAQALDSGAALQATLSAIVHKKLGVRDVTLYDLRQRTGVDLVVVVTDATTASVRYLRADTEPAMSTVQAVYASMALAPLLPPLEYCGHLLQDGGGMDPVPADVWADKPEPTLSFALHWTDDASAESGTGGVGAGAGAGGELSGFAISAATADAPAPGYASDEDERDKTDDDAGSSGSGSKDTAPVAAGASASASASAIALAKAPAVGTGSTGGKAGKSRAKRRPTNVLAYLSRTLYCALYPSKVLHWCLMTPRARASCIVLDSSDVATVDLRLSAELKERARSKGYQDAAAALFLMADGKPPHRGAQRFARSDGLPVYVRSLLGAAYEADAVYARACALAQPPPPPTANFASLFYPFAADASAQEGEKGRRACTAPFMGMPCGVCPACTGSCTGSESN